MSSEEEDEVVPLSTSNAILGGAGPLSLGDVDAVHHKVKVQCSLPLTLSGIYAMYACTPCNLASSLPQLSLAPACHTPVPGQCQCHFGDQIVSASLDQNGNLCCFAPPPKVI